ncbi:MAG: nucleotidyltransferase domain-containing protein [Anaerolineae bacterium]|nr:nucleotidyltransferase domain-containing protein [Anaerolineae bacterium]MCI0608676.1 nucleotidyltransferase domain-containing protein [Anaerolineae bacterium]
MSAISIFIPSQEKLSPIAKRFGLRFIVLFGSAARGKMHEESDIDVGVLTDRPMTFNKRLKLWYELSNLFHAEIDLAVLNHPNPLFGFEVARDSRLLYERDKNAWENWKSYVVRHYWDTAKFRQDLQKRLAERVERARHAVSQ